MSSKIMTLNFINGFIGGAMLFDTADIIVILK